MKQIFSTLLVLFLGFMLVSLIPLAQPTEPGPVASHYLNKGVEENHGANLVTSVIVNYRGFDTLGEVTVLFLSVAGVGFVLRRSEGNRRTGNRPSSEILQTGARMLFAPIVVFGAYIFVHGHLSPGGGFQGGAVVASAVLLLFLANRDHGGGFQGGAVVASAVLLLFLANRDHQLPHKMMHWMESLVGFTYVMVGISGLVIAGSFLSNQGVLPLGTWNRLFSGGVIPIIYILVGLKVGTELASLLDTLMESGRPRNEGGGH